MSVSQSVVAEVSQSDILEVSQSVTAQVRHSFLKSVISEVIVREERYNLLEMAHDLSKVAPAIFCRLIHFLQVPRYSLGGLR